MNPERFYVPYYMGMRNLPISNSMLANTNSIPRSMGLFSKITNGIRSVNWSGFLTNANKTLDVVNQAIPLVRQAGPMVNNMKSMLRIAKAFGSETNNSRHTNKNYNSRLANTINSTNNSISRNKDIETSVQKKEVQNDNAPNFFI